ncbi:MAG TPA: M56 family metallopeptidase, partial [Rhizomicrobium sp.]|nr:M56 family metallopeptidase [Rhizomicrobium sp.]
QLSPAEMDAILAHELCHLRRRDNLLAALHMLVEGLFWFNPLVWWIGRRLVEERERACDEAVVAAGIRPLVYAEGILKTCRFYVQSPLACASGVSGADLKVRLGAIMAQRPVMELHPAQGLLLMLASTAVVMLPLSAGMMGSAPVSRIALRAATILAAPQLVAPVIPPVAEMPKAAAVHHAHHVRVTAQSEEHPLPATPTVSWMGVRLPAMRIDIALDARLPLLATPGPDPVTCRKPEQLADSHLPGPEVCLHKSEWDQLKTKNEEVTPDGHGLIHLDYAKRQGMGKLCTGTFSPGATTGFSYTPTGCL